VIESCRIGACRQVTYVFEKATEVKILYKYVFKVFCNFELLLNSVAYNLNLNTLTLGPILSQCSPFVSSAFRFSGDHFPKGFPTKIMYTFLSSNPHSGYLPSPF